MLHNEKQEIAGDLSQWVAEQIWGEFGTFRLGRTHPGYHMRGDHVERCYHGDTWEVVGSDEPGLEAYDEYAILLRRERDGKIIEAEIDIHLYEVKHDGV